MKPTKSDEWNVIEKLLPPSWREAARSTGAFRRARYIDDPGRLLRLLLFHAVNDAGLRETVAQARMSGIAAVSQVALLKRLRTAGGWLAWLGQGLCRTLRDDLPLPMGLRPRIVDSTTVQGPASRGITWRLHYALDLQTLSCDWFELTDVHGGEFLERTPSVSGDVLLADRNFLRPEGVQAVVEHDAHVLIRLRWSHPPMTTPDGRPFSALTHARKLRVGKVGSWSVRLSNPQGVLLSGRVVAIKLPAPLAARARRKAVREAHKKGWTADPRSLIAAHLVMIFTTLPEELLGPEAVLELYRYRWQIELAFKRLKQLLSMGRVPHNDTAAAKSWILAKLIVALLLEILFRNARAFSPWGYDLRCPAQAENQPLALDGTVHTGSAAIAVPGAPDCRPAQSSQSGKPTPCRSRRQAAT